MIVVMLVNVVMIMRTVKIWEKNILIMIIIITTNGNHNMGLDYSRFTLDADLQGSS